jgi:putative ABC transport system permease protein
VPAPSPAAPGGGLPLATLRFLPDPAPALIRSFFLVALRTIRRQRGFAFINIFGLAAGIACCLLIALLVLDERAYDRHHEHADRAYRVVTAVTAPNTPQDHFAVTSRPMGAALRERYPEVAAAVRLVPTSLPVRRGADVVRDLDVYYAEPGLFEVFTFPMAEGDPASALAEPYAVALTERAARRLFGDGPALGQSLVLFDTLGVQVTGVLQDPPTTSHFSFDLLVSYATYEVLQPMLPEPDWLNLGVYTYLLLQPGVDAAAFEEKIRGLVQEEFGEVLAPVGVEVEVGLEPLPEIYLHSRRQAAIGPVGDARLVTAFAAIALFVLLIACVNYMNLATARSLQRAREVGVRKALGAGRGPLVGQFLGESVLTVGLALVVALLLVAVTLPWFNAVSGKAFSFWSLLRPEGLLALLGLVLVVGVVAGSYPAAVLSAFQPARVLKGELTTSRRGARLRQGLVVFQFAVSVALIAGTLVVIGQLRYMQGQDLGFQKAYLVALSGEAVPPAERAPRMETAKAELAAVPGVVSVTASAATPGAQLPLLLTLAEGLMEGDSRRMHYLFADADFPETYHLQLVAGRLLSAELEGDAANNALLNETAVAALGWTPEEALGRWVQLGGGEGLRRTVVGVVRDYHHFALRQAVEPMVVMALPQTFQTLSVRLGGAGQRGALPVTLEGLRRAWEGVFPGHPFTYAFIDDTFDQQYQAEARLTQILGTFAGLAVLIACLGLFGLAAYTTALRRKEIGIRKTLGASVTSLVVLLSRRFAALVAVAFVLAVPAAYFALDAFLGGFAYRMPLQPGVFLLAGGLALLVAMLTVGSQALRAANADPVRALRSE